MHTCPGRLLLQSQTPCPSYQTLKLGSGVYSHLGLQYIIMKHWVLVISKTQIRFRNHICLLLLIAVFPYYQRRVSNGTLQR